MADHSEGSQQERTERRTAVLQVLRATGQPPAGVGKTRLALELAREHLGRRAAGVWLVDLAATEGAPDPAGEAARRLGMGVPVGSTATQALRGGLASRNALLVLDNCDHVVDACARLAAVLLSSCLGVRIMATSREPLRIPGETVWRLEPLEPHDAHRLFLERARQRRPQLVPDGEDGATIAELCARLDRLPLAIELAAALVSAMSPAEVLAGVRRRLGELGGGDRLAPAHHRTVRAAVDWSYQLLDPAERRAFRSLAAFVGGFDAAAAESVAPGLSLQVLARLVDASLVSVSQMGDGRTRYALLETVREHARERLVEAGEWDTARARHLRHFSALADLARRDWRSTGRHRLVNELDDDYENVRAAVERAVASRAPCAAMRLLAGARDLFFRFGQAEGLRLAHLLLERCPARDADRAEVQLCAGQLAVSVGDVEAARSLLAQARELAAELGEPVLEAWARFFQGLAETLTGAVDSGREHLEASRALHRRLASPIGEARATAVLGIGHLIAGEPVRARALLEAALAIYLAEEDGWGQGQCHTFLGMIAESSDPRGSRATAHYRTAVERLLPSRDATLLPVALVGQAGVMARADPAGALRVAAAASTIRSRVGGGFAPFYRARVDGIRAAAKAALGDDVQRVWADGASLAVGDAIALAFGMRGRRPLGPAELSARELEVAGLVAAGLSNRAIAARLHLSVRTVETHVRNALSKVGLDNRTQLATWTRERVQWPLRDRADDGAPADAYGRHSRRGRAPGADDTRRRSDDGDLFDR